MAAPNKVLGFSLLRRVLLVYRARGLRRRGVVGEQVVQVQHARAHERERVEKALFVGSSGVDKTHLAVVIGI